MSHDLIQMLGCKLDLTMIIDYLSLFNVIMHASATTKQTLMINIRAALKSYQRFMITNLV